MFMSTSREFVTLCRSQLALISTWGASLSVVYLTEKFTEEGKGKLIPILAYPEASREWEATEGLKALPSPSGIESVESIPRSLAAASTSKAIAPAREESDGEAAPKQRKVKDSSWQQQRQIVLPLIEDEIMVGLLVSARPDRPWNQQEKTLLQEVATTIAIACILDQRSQWLKQEFREQKQLQAQQYNSLHDLLHQFKSPLTALGTFGKLLLKRLLPGDKNWQVANSILRESDRLRELLEQIDKNVDIGEEIISLPAQGWEANESDLELVVSADRQDKFEDFRVAPPALDELESGRARKAEKQERQPLPLLPGSDFIESVSVSEILEPLLVSARAIADEKQLDLQAYIPEDLPSVQGNNKALREVSSNLIDNALKYTPSGGHIYIIVGEDAEAISEPELSKIAIAISDTGYGIPAVDLEHLFERNYRGEKANTDIPGTGLGLAIARDLVHQMQGEIEVFSPVVTQWLPIDLQQKDEAINLGTTVVLWFQILNKEDKAKSLNP